MPRQYKPLAAGALLLLLGGAAEADVAKSGNPAFDRAVELVMENFYDPSALPRFEDTVKETIPTLPQSRDQKVVDPALQKVLTSLGASHTGHYTADELDYYELLNVFQFNYRRELPRLFPPEGRIVYPGIGIASKVIDGKRFVTAVYDGGPAKSAGVEQGDEVVSADGAPFEEIGSFHGKIGKSVDLALRREADAAPITVPVPVAELQPAETLVSAISNSVSVVERGGHRIGYLHIWFYADHDVGEAIDQALSSEPLKNVDALVLDLRCRWGGAPPDAAETFLGGTQPFRFIDRKGEGHLSNVRWHKPLVAIIDGGTRSGLEVFAYDLKARGVPLIGVRTAGALLGGRGFLLPDDSLLELAVAGVEVNGEKIEGKGVEPDVVVPFDLRYAAGRDPQRDAAVTKALSLLSEG
jgi:C-terminal processing protease CtpA/Prc